MSGYKNSISDIDGNVGIGTTSPSQKLDVNGDVFINSNYTGSNWYANDLTIGKTTTGNHGITIATGPTYTGSIYFGDSDNNDSGIIKYQHSNNSMQFVTNRYGQPAFTIDNASNATFAGTVAVQGILAVQGSGNSYIQGNLGIGTTSPASFYPGNNNLVVGNGVGEKAITVYAGNTSTAYYFFAKGTTGVDRYHGQVRYNFNSDKMEFTTGGSISSKFTIKSTGVLQVPSLGQGFLQTDSSGNISTSGGGTLPGGPYLPLSAGASYPLTGSLYLANVGSDQKIQFQRTGGNVYSIEHDSAQLYFYNRTTTESPLVIQNDGDVLMNAGNVGIGTTSPGAKLDVSGVTKTDSILINATSPIASSIVTLNKASTSTGTDVGQFYNITKENTTNSTTSVIYGVVNRVDSTSAFENRGMVTQNNVGRVTGTGDFSYVYPSYNQASAKGTGTVDYVVAGYNEASLDNASGTVNYLWGTHTEVQLKAGTVGNISLLNFDFDQTAGTTITGDFQYIHITNEQPVSNISGTARALNIESDLPSFFSGSIGIGTNSPQSKLQVDGGVQMADDTDAASASKVGTLRYRTSGNNSYVDMCMQTGATTYEWINIVQNNW